MSERSSYNFSDDVREFIQENPDVIEIVVDFINRQPHLESVVNDLVRIYVALVECFDRGGKLFLCGNGGSFADCLHISGEMMKSYERMRPLKSEDREKFRRYPGGEKLAEALEYGLPALVLGNNPSFKSAVENDIAEPNTGYAHELYALGSERDVLLGISTSGNAQNVKYAMITAKVLGMRTIGLTGEPGGDLAKMADIVVKAPAQVTNRVQELHEHIYHTLCSMVEAHYFQERR